MRRVPAPFLKSPLCVGLLLALPSLLSAQGDAEVMRSATSAAPASVTAEATVVRTTFPPSEGAGGDEVLREGSNGWVCMPDNPDVPGDSPACLDAVWRGFLDALTAGEQPRVEGLGVGYMLRGDFPVSNVDPGAGGPTPDNEWIRDSGPHVMLLVSDPAELETLPTSPGDGPWVMWAGTPYAHVMLPVPGMPRH